MEAGFRTVTNGRSKPPFSRWEFIPGSWPRRIAVVLIVVAICAAVETQVWGRSVAAWMTRSTPRDPAIYERAIQLDPRNAAYHFRLGQLYNSTDNLDVQRARHRYRAAVALNPHRSAYWLELAKFEENEGDAVAARDAIAKALDADPRHAQTHWAAANFHIRQGVLAEADRELRRTVELDPAYMTQALDLAWRFYQDPEKVFSTHVPDSKATNLTALGYFINIGNDPGAALAWNRLRGFETSSSERSAYVDYLVNRGNVDEAWRVFQFPGEGRAFFNGSFESEPTNGGFDWRISSTRDALARRDSGSAKEGLACLAVTFSGKENIEFAGQVSHWLAVEEGKSYALSFWMKTEGITTNEGVFVEVDGQTSEKQLGTNYWTQFTIPFTASRDLVTVRLRRVPSSKFDNLLKGKVWLDAFHLLIR